MLQKFKNLSTIPKIIIGIIAIALFPITLIVLSAYFTVKNFKQKNIGKSIIGIILVLLFAPASVAYISGVTNGFSSVSTESASNDAPKENSINVKKETSNDDTSTEASNIKPTYSIKHGNFIEAYETDGVLVVKAKIEPNLTNKMTIMQNGYNVEDIIKNQGGDKFDELRYWAVSDMASGDECKVISFTLDKNLINRVKNETLLGNEIVENSNDLWILPSLLKK
jgi:hypothetical protein